MSSKKSLKHNKEVHHIPFDQASMHPAAISSKKITYKKNKNRK